MLLKYSQLILRDYLNTKESNKNREAINNYFEQIQIYLQKSSLCSKYEYLKIKYSTGKGSMALVPWISILNEHITTSTQRGIYCVYLFCEDMSGLYLTFNQGVNAKISESVKIDNIIKAEKKRDYLRTKPYLQNLDKYKIKITNDIDLKRIGFSDKARAYERATIAYKYYNVKDIPSDGELLRDLNIFIEIYNSFFYDNYYLIHDDKPKKRYVEKEKIENEEDILKELEQSVESSLKLSKFSRTQRIQNANPIPKQVEAKSIVYLRNADVIAEILLRANGICEKCKRPAPFTRKSDGSPYLEVHHRLPLSKGGLDILENAIAVCPNCHRSLHYG